MKTSTTLLDMQPTDRKKLRAAPISAATEKRLAHLCKAMHFTPEGMIAALVTGASRHLHYERSIAFPIRLLGPRQIPVLFHGEKLQRLEAAATENQTSATWLARILIQSGLERLERGDLRIIQPGETEAPSFPCPAPSPEVSQPKRPAPVIPKPVRIRPGQTRKLLVIAELLNVRPQDFLDWHIDPYLKDLLNPGSRELEMWAEELLVYPDEKERQRVIARVKAWTERKKRALARRKTTKETGVEA